MAHDTVLAIYLIFVILIISLMKATSSRSSVSVACVNSQVGFYLVSVFQGFIHAIED